MKPSPQRLQDWLVLERTSRLLQLVQSVEEEQVLQAGSHLKQRWSGPTNQPSPHCPQVWFTEDKTAAPSQDVQMDCCTHVLQLESHLEMDPTVEAK
jgi:hypothetical protein